MLKTLSVVFLVSLGSVPVRAGSLASPVVGGTSVPLGTWPDVVAVIAPGAMCTGTLIAPDVVLTAGHCIGIHPTEVRVDTVDLARPGGETIAVKSARAYPGWEDHYDVGVLMLEHPAAPAPRAVASACLVRERLAAGAPVRVVGFGLTSRSGTGSNTRLHQAVLPVDDATCETDPSCQPAIAPGGELTAGTETTDACFGDSGGPLYLDTPDGPALVGVVSRGRDGATWPCAGGGVYVRADRVVAWIEQVTGRRLARTPCDGPADDGGDPPATAGGCAAAPGSSGAAAPCVLGALGVVARRRRRRRRRGDRR